MAAHKFALLAQSLYVWNWGGGVTCHIFGYGRAAGVPGPQPIHILGKVNKTDPFIYFP